MRAGRLLALLFELQRVGSATAAALAERLEVSVRTVYRDVAELQAAGVPLWTEPGRGGGIRLLDGWDATLGTASHDAGALFVASTAEVGLGAVFAQARVRDRYLLDAPGWFGVDRPAHLATVAAAVWEPRRLHLHYGRPRVVEPLGLVLKAGIWYLVAGTAADGTPRTFRVARIVDAPELGEPFERPADFDLAAWWRASGAEFDRSLLRERVRLRLSAPALHRLADVVGEAAASLAEVGDPDADGWREVEVPVESIEVAVDQLVALGGGVEALHPVLRAGLAQIGRRLAERNS